MRTIREQLEDRESLMLTKTACRSAESKGRSVREELCTVRTVFQHDRDRILHSKSFRRLKHKTQVFLAPEGDHYRTRLTHTLEVAQIARTIARALALNEDLTEAIALGHDLGHAPFGHAGERVLAELLPEGFQHVVQSLRVVENLENDGRGLNLTYEVRDGIRRHSKGLGPIIGNDPSVRAETLEGRIVRVADIIAYVNHDLDDAIRAGLVDTGAIPPSIVQQLGETPGRRIDVLVRDVIAASLDLETTDIALSQNTATALGDLRDWLFDYVYRAPRVHDDFVKASRIVRELFLYFCADRERLVAAGGRPLEGDPIEVSAADFIAGMTDRFALNLYGRLFLPQPWKIL